jgi:dihydrofolate reductase
MGCVSIGGTTFHFVTEGIEGALERAREAAGGKEVRIAGGANVIQQFLEAGLVGEIQVHLAPVLLGDGVRLFERIGADPVELLRSSPLGGSRMSGMAMPSEARGARVGRTAQNSTHPI